VEFGKLDKCLSKYGKHFECDNEKIIYSSDINSDDTFIILNGVISLRRGENVLVGIAQAPFIMGLSDGVMKTDIQYRLITESDCRIPSTCLTNN
jgi:hypothetical protein